MPHLHVEKTLTAPVGGVDEAGRGPWAGPVVAATVVFLEPDALPLSLREGIQDSKKLSKQRREALFQELTQTPAIAWGAGIATVEEIDHLNILRATFLAMERAVAALNPQPNALLVDGKMAPSFSGIPTQTLVGGDGISLSIASASIIAKVKRDKIMADLGQAYPLYGWDRNAGYGTAHHQEALRLYGITPHHRRSFAPIRKLLETAQIPA